MLYGTGREPEYLRKIDLTGNKGGVDFEVILAPGRVVIFTLCQGLSVLVRKTVDGFAGTVLALVHVI